MRAVQYSTVQYCAHHARIGCYIQNVWGPIHLVGVCMGLVGCFGADSQVGMAHARSNQGCEIHIQMYFLYLYLYSYIQVWLS